MSLTGKIAESEPDMHTNPTPAQAIIDSLNADFGWSFYYTGVVNVYFHKTDAGRICIQPGMLVWRTTEGTTEVTDIDVSVGKDSWNLVDVDAATVDAFIRTKLAVNA